MTYDELPFDVPADRPATGKGTVCRHAKAHRTPLPEGGWMCRCGWVVTPEVIRRARRSIRQGKDAEREIAADTKGKRVGHLGGEVDVISPVPRRFVIQSKRIEAPGRGDERARRPTFPEWMWDELRKLPATGGDVPCLIVSDKPGPGQRRRSIVAVDYRDYVDLYGEPEEAA
jgi:hypothetical protein